MLTATRDWILNIAHLALPASIPKWDPYGLLMGHLGASELGPQVGLHVGSI